MKDSNEKDNIRFDKLYQLLGDEVNKVYETEEDNTNVTDEEKSIHTESAFNDVFNIFNSQDQLNNEAFINAINAKNNHEYVKELNDLIDDYTDEAINEYDSDNLFSELKDVFNAIEESDVNNENTPIDEEIYIEPTKIEVANKISGIEKEKDNAYHIEKKNNIRNQTLISSKNDYDDGLDEMYPPKTIIDILSNRKTIYILLIIIFFVMAILVVKAFHFGKLVDIYNEYTTETSKETDDNTRIYDDEVVDAETLKKAAADELIDCINAPIDTNKLSNELSSTIKEINDYYHTSGKYYAFAYKDLFTGFTVSYNENGNIFAASTIKAPVNIYLYEMASQGKINLDDKLTYTANYYNDGTGVLKNQKINTNYSIRTLSEYAIRNSDNAAHNMLMDKYGRNNIKKFWQAKGTNIILTGNDNWGLINAHDAMIYMKELYTFYINDNEYGNELMTNFVGAKTKFITGKNNYKVANKTGWSGSSQHDVAIVFADNPYIVVALSNLGYDDNYMSYFNKVNDLANKLHNEYWKYKMNMCNNIKQYD